MVLFWTWYRNASEITDFSRNLFEHFPLEVSSHSIYTPVSFLKQLNKYIPEDKWDKESNQNHQVHTWTTRILEIMRIDKIMVKKLVFLKVACICYSAYFWGSRKPYNHGASLTLLDFVSLFITKSKNTLPEKNSFKKQTSHQKQ